MTIRVKKDRIEFVSDEGTTYTLRETGDGFSFDGVIEGTNIFQDGFQGTVAGFSSGGASDPGIYDNTIDKFPFASDTNATNVGDLTVGRYLASSQSSTTHGYTSAGRAGPPENPPFPYVNTIDKFPFSTNSNATDVGDTTTGNRGSTGQSSSISGYVSGGFGPPVPGLSNVIDKFPFATDTNATDIGDLTQAREIIGAGQSSVSSGYTSGGNNPATPVNFNTIDKFPFATDTNATDVGDLTIVKHHGAGQSSLTHGYHSGGYTSPPTRTNIIDKFPFATDTGSTDIGDLSQTRGCVAGQSSAASGYTSGGNLPALSNVIDKFPFSADSNATDVGDLTVARQNPAGTQN